MPQVMGNLPQIGQQCVPIWNTLRTMTTPASPQTLTDMVLWSGLALGLVLGAVTQASRFCTMGALSDWFNFRGTGRLISWALAVAVAVLGSLALTQGMGVDLDRATALNKELLWLSYGVGGVILGWGMVLASGCPQRNLVRLGSGSLKALVTLLVIGLAAQMTLRGWVAVLRSRWLDTVNLPLSTTQDAGAVLGALFGASSAATPRLVVGLVLAALLLAWCVARRRDSEASQWWGGAAVGVVVTLAWALTGYGGYLAEHPDTLEPAWLATATRRPEGISFSAPLAHSLDLLTLWSDQGLKLTVGVTITLGVILGAGLMAWRRGEFRLEGFRDLADLQRHLVGGVMVGVGGVTAMGCSIGQGITGLSVLSLGAVLVVASIALGVWLGLKWEMRGL